MDPKSPKIQDKVKSIRSFENSKEISDIYYIISRNKRQIKEECKKYFIRQGGNVVIESDILVNVLTKMFPGKLDGFKWKLIISVGDKNRNNLIDIEYLFNQLGFSNKLNISHPHPKI